MKQTDPLHSLTCEFLKFVRDNSPTKDEIISWFGESAASERFHVLRKAKVIVDEAGRFRLSSKHLAPDGRTFRIGNHLFKIDTNEVLITQSNGNARRSI